MVLIVEDHPLVQITASVLIEDAGMATVVAADADAALDILTSRDDIHAVFTDVSMPGSMDGVALAQVVRQRWPDIQLVVTSGDQLPEDTCLPCGVAFLRKPYEYANVIGELLGDAA
ncbi:response regulator [Sphingomonas sp. PB2P19]|uniref:response regulator n=1 Tax=Sphingomonas rhamnosi TaxID=3096156 RepID=UPI002FC68443